MELSLDSKLRRIIRERLKSGKYASAEEVVAAALVTLDQQETMGEFAPGELNALLAEGEESIEREGTLDGDEAYELRRAKRKKLSR